MGAGCREESREVSGEDGKGGDSVVVDASEAVEAGS